MYPILHFRDTFARNANLVAHTPTPSGGPAWEYDDIAGAWTCHATGYLDGPVAASTAPARNLFSLPVGVKRWRMSIDILRGGTDFVGGGFLVHALQAPGPIASWTQENSISFGVARRDANSVQFSVQYNRPASPPGPATVALRSADIEHLANTWRRYILQVDELLGLCELFLADAFTGANEMTDTEASTLISPPTGDGLFTAELAAHVANDTTHRLIGVQGGWASTGMVYFAVTDLRVYELEVLPTGNPCKCLLQVFDDDRTTVLWEVSTDPLHAAPYLKEPSNYGEQQVDVARGSASLTTVEVTVIDPAQILGDQDSGWLTERLSYLALGNIGGRRCRLIRFIPDALYGLQVIADGPASQPTLVNNYSAYSWNIRDNRDTERRVRLFDLLNGDADAIVGVAPTTPEEPGIDDGVTWGTKYH